MRIRRLRIKICLVGDRGVGKTSLIQRYVAGKFQEDEAGTLGAHLYPVEVDVPYGDRELVKVKIAIFDFMGEHAMRENFRDAMFYGAHGALPVCDLGRRESLYSLLEWVQDFSAVAGDVPLSIVLNKADLGQGIEVGMDEMRWLRERFPLVPTILTSAMNGQGVEDAFNGIIGRAVDHLLETRQRSQANRLLRHRILALIARRENEAMSKGELIGAFKGTDPKIVMDELDNLVILGLLEQAEYGPDTSVKTGSIPVSFHFRLTETGRKAATEPESEELVVDELA